MEREKRERYEARLEQMFERQSIVAHVSGPGRPGGAAARALAPGDVAPPSINEVRLLAFEPDAHGVEGLVVLADEFTGDVGLSVALVGEERNLDALRPVTTWFANPASAAHALAAGWARRMRFHDERAVAVVRAGLEAAVNAGGDDDEG